MKQWQIIAALIAVIGVAWWLFIDNDEDKIRAAHETLIELLQKTGDEGDAPTLLDALALQGLFAETCVVSGDADAVVGSYTGQQLASTVLQVKALFERVEITTTEFIIEMIGEGAAEIEFSATLDGTSVIEGEEHVLEARTVFSRMDKIDGEWLFSGFRLIE